MSLPQGVRPWKSQRDLPLDQVTEWEVDSQGEVDEHGERLKRLRVKAKASSLAQAVAQRRRWLLTLTAEGKAPEPPPPPPPEPKPKAAKAKAKAKAAKPKSEKKPAAPGDMTLRAFYEGSYTEDMERRLHAKGSKHIRFSTIVNRHSMIKVQILPVLGDWPLSRVNSREGHDAFRAALDKAVGKRTGKPLSITTKNHLLVIIGAMMTVAADPTKHPTPLIPHRLRLDLYPEKQVFDREIVTMGKVRWGEDRYKRYSDPDIRKIEAALRDDWDVVAYGLGRYCACRVSEACARTYDDVDAKNSRIYVGTQVTLETPDVPPTIGPTKNDGTGWVRVPLRMIEAIERLKKTAISEFLLLHPLARLQWRRGAQPNGRKKPTASAQGFMTRNHLGYRWRKICKRAGVSKSHYHALRHTCLSSMADGGAPAERIKEIARHTQIQTTFRYITPRLEDLDKAAEAGWKELPQAAE